MRVHQSHSEPLIRSFAVDNLFGRRSYIVNVPNVGGQQSNLVLIHGDNGSGKTTLLRLLWNALSYSGSHGHRGFLARTPFSELRIEMTTGARLTVSKTDGLLGSFFVSFHYPGEPEQLTFYEANDDLSVRAPSHSNRRFIEKLDLLSPTVLPGGGTEARRLTEEIRTQEAYIAAERRYLGYLEGEVKTALYLADDRVLYSDDPETNRIRESLNRREERERRERLARLVFVELQLTIRRVNEYLRGLTLGGQSEGSANNNAIYANVLRRLVASANPRPGDSETAPSRSTSEWLDVIQRTAPRYEEFELVPKFDVVEFRSLLAEADRSGLGDLAERVISPFLSSLYARYEALSEAQEVLNSFIPTVNRFFSDKVLRFSPKIGLTIQTSDGDTLDVESLSSGERQLLTLLSNSVLARTNTRLFIIDEPELSLGVEWQRAILDALTSLTKGTGVQFIVATHSIEIITSRPEALVELRTKAV